MAYIPPGPQVPFDPNRQYGQEPGGWNRVPKWVWCVIGFFGFLLLVGTCFAGIS